MKTQTEAFRTAFVDEHGQGTNPNKRISAADVRDMCGGVSDMTLHRWLKDRDFPSATYIGRRRYWKETEVIAWLEAQPRGPASCR